MGASAHSGRCLHRSITPFLPLCNSHALDSYLPPPPPWLHRVEYSLCPEKNFRPTQVLEFMGIRLYSVKCRLGSLSISLWEPVLSFPDGLQKGPVFCTTSSPSSGPYRSLAWLPHLDASFMQCITNLTHIVSKPGQVIFLNIEFGKILSCGNFFSTGGVGSVCSPPPPPFLPNTPFLPAHESTLMPFVTHLSNTVSYGTIKFIWQNSTTFTLSLAVPWTFLQCQSFTKLWGGSSSPMGLQEGSLSDHLIGSP